MKKIFGMVSLLAVSTIAQASDFALISDINVPARRTLQITPFELSGRVEPVSVARPLMVQRNSDAVLNALIIKISSQVEQLRAISRANGGQINVNLTINEAALNKMAMLLRTNPALAAQLVSNDGRAGFGGALLGGLIGPALQAVGSIGTGIAQLAGGDDAAKGFQQGFGLVANSAAPLLGALTSFM